MPLGSGWTDGVSIGSASARKGGRPMDFEVTYSEEQQRFRAEVRAWLTEHVAPDITRMPASPEDNYRRYQQLRALGRDLGAKGWLFPRAPVTYGGGGLDVDHAIILEEEIDRFDLTLPPYYDSGGRLGAASILVWGTEEQKRAWRPCASTAPPSRRSTAPPCGRSRATGARTRSRSSSTPSGR